MSTNKYSGSKNNGSNKLGNKSNGDTWDDDLMWQSIETELDKDDKKRRGLWILFPGFIIASAIVLFLFTTPFNSDSINIKNTEATTLNRKDAKFNSQTGESKESILRNNASNNTLKNTLAKNNLNKNLNGTAQSQKAINKLKQNFNNPKPIITENKFHKKDHKLNDSKKRLNLSSSDNPFTPTKYSKIPTNHNQSARTNQAQNNGLISTINALKSLEPNLIESIQVIDSISLDIQTAHFTKPNLYSSSPFFISYMSLSHNTYSNVFDSSLDWATAKNANETPKYSLNLSAIYAKPISRSLFIGAGIEVSRNVSNLIAIDSFSTSMDIEADSAIVVNATEPLYLSGTRTLTTKTSRSYNVYNKIDRLGIPVLIGYQKVFGDRRIMLSAGTTINVIRKLRGYSISPDGHILSYTNLNQEIEKNKIINSIRMTAHYSQRLTANLSCLVGGHYIMPIGSHYTLSSPSNETFEKNIHAYGIDLGILYDF